MQRFHLYRNADARIYAVETTPELARQFREHAHFEPLTDAPVDAGTAIRAVLQSGGVVLRKGRRPWRSDTRCTLDPALSPT